MRGDLVDFICARAQMKGFEKLVCTDEHFLNLEKMMKNTSFFIELGGIQKMLICAQLLFFSTFGAIFRGWFMGLKGAKNVEIPTFLGLLGLFFEDGLFLLYTLYTLLLE